MSLSWAMRIWRIVKIKYLKMCTYKLDNVANYWTESTHPLSVCIMGVMYPYQNWFMAFTPPTKSLWTVLPGADSTITVRLFQQVAVRKPLYVNHPNKICFKGHILYWSWQKMITIGFIGTMHVSLLNKPIELYNSTTNFAIFSISLQIFTNAMETPDGVHIIKSMV